MFENRIKSLQDWYAAQCDGEWEHACGLNIRTLDNPGWHLSINLEGTGLEKKMLKEVADERSEHDWIHCRIKEGRFDGHCGPKNLDELIALFLEWSSGK